MLDLACARAVAAFSALRGKLTDSERGGARHAYLQSATGRRIPLCASSHALLIQCSEASTVFA